MIGMAEEFRMLAVTADMIGISAFAGIGDALINSCYLLPRGRPSCSNPRRCASKTASPRECTASLP